MGKAMIGLEKQFSVFLRLAAAVLYRFYCIIINFKQYFQ